MNGKSRNFEAPVLESGLFTNFITRLYGLGLGPGGRVFTGIFLLISVLGFTQPAFAKTEFELVSQDNMFEYHVKKITWLGREGVSWKLKNKTDIQLHVGTMQVDYQCNGGDERMEHYLPQDIPPGKMGRASYTDWPCPKGGKIIGYSVKDTNFHQKGKDYDYNKIKCGDDVKRLIIKKIDQDKSKIIIQNGLTIMTHLEKDNHKNLKKLVCDRIISRAK
jgi:hypothetical protein